MSQNPGPVPQEQPEEKTVELPEEEGLLQEETCPQPDGDNALPSIVNVEELAVEAAALQERNEELAAALAAARADFFNYRKRIERDRQREKIMVGEEKAMEFLPVLDNLDRALSVSADADGKSVLQGVSMVRRQFLSVLEKLGVEAIPTVGVPFSPELHEAVAAEETDDLERNGLVTEEIQSGYRTKDRVLRPAKVKVASYSGEEKARIEPFCDFQ